MKQRVYLETTIVKDYEMPVITTPEELMGE